MRNETTNPTINRCRADRRAEDPARLGLRRCLPPGAVLATLALAALLLGGCGRRDEADSPIPKTPPPSATAAVPVSIGAVPLAMALSSPVSGLSFSAVELGSSTDAKHRIRMSPNRFTPASTIHAMVETMGSGDAVLSLDWMYQDGVVVHRESRDINATGPRTTEFTLSKPGGLAAGDYTLKISLNGNPVDSRDFSVR